MKNNSFIFLLVLILTFSIGAVATANEDNEEISLAIVSFTDVAGEVLEEGGEIEMLSQAEVGEITQEMGYELAVDATTVDLYLGGIIGTITCLNNEEVTEEVEEIIEGKEEVEEVKELDEVKDLTEEVIEELQS